jgi:hypothetical protein
MNSIPFSVSLVERFTLFEMMASKSELVSALIDQKLEDEKNEDAPAVGEKRTDEDGAGTAEDDAAAGTSSSSGAAGKLPPALAQWVTAGAAGLKVAVEQYQA